MVEAGKKAAQVRATATYEFDEHLEGKPAHIQSLMHSIREFIVGLDPAIEEVPKKFYVAYKISQNIVCMEPQSRNINLFVKLRAADIESPPKFYRDVTEIGHYGTGDTESVSIGKHSHREAALTPEGDHDWQRSCCSSTRA